MSGAVLNAGATGNRYDNDPKHIDVSMVVMNLLSLAELSQGLVPIRQT